MKVVFNLEHPVVWNNIMLLLHARHIAILLFFHFPFNLLPFPTYSAPSLHHNHWPKNVLEDDDSNKDDGDIIDAERYFIDELPILN